MLALGWFSVESVRGAKDHPHRVRERVCAACNSLPKPSCRHDHADKISELKPGQSLPSDLANQMLRATLSTCKDVIEEAVLAEWASDCVLALTAHIRPDAVIVNRAAAFAEWEKSVGAADADMPEQARRILFAMCGDGFTSLTLPEEEAVKQDDQADGDSPGADDAEGEDVGRAKGVSDDAEPSNASRGVFGDLFGGDAAEKVSRAAGKEEFAVSIRAMLKASSAPPTREMIVAFRQRLGLPDLDTSKPDKYPKEVSSSGAPTAVAKRYRKLLVSLRLWPTSDEEGGLPRASAVSSFGKHVTAQDEQSRNAQINALDLIDACPEPVESANGETNAAPTSGRVFTPPWAPELADRVAAATDMPVNAKPLNEFKRLMFALAARRISQTQTWTKRNEAERHKAAVKEDAAKKKLEELDPDGSSRAWFSAYEVERGEDSRSLSDFRITRRMIGECDAVFKAWQGAESAEERETKTATVQAKAEKFGDARLYADLSEDPAVTAIWRHEQGAEILKQWVKLRQAQYDQQRLKIPRFCHPDPFHHPTWCEFGGSSKPKVWYAWKPDSKPQSPEPGGDADGSRRLWMLLPDFHARRAKAVPMRWRSKRLSQDLGGVNGYTDASVPRADRLSLAAANLPLLGAMQQPIRYRPAHPFTKDAKGWNARLQLDRETLERLERHWDEDRRDWKDKGRALRSARWFVTFAPALAVSEGPGSRIHPKLGWKSYPHSELNKKQKREGQAQLVLSRLPGLRVLSLDLGHRFAAACAVWETLSAATFKQALAGGAVVAGGSGPNDLYCHVQTNGSDGRERTTVFRRVGPDTLDGKPHPAPWARLDRQFLIKLQGEHETPRKMSQAELTMLDRWRNAVGAAELPAARKPRNVAAGMADGARLLMLAIRRHADRARIAHNLTASTRTRPGGQPEALDRAGRVQLVAETLALWHGLFSGEQWTDGFAQALWTETHLPVLASAVHSGGEEGAPAFSGAPRREAQKAFISELRPHAERIVSDGALAKRLSELWADRWERDDRVLEHRGHRSGLLRELRRWVAPRGLANNPDAARAARHVGGLSVGRINTITATYRLVKAFKNRPVPADLRRNVPAKGDDQLSQFHQRLLDMRDRLRDQRVKQLASRIVEAALGVGRMARERVQAGAARPPARVDAPCHAVVIESLTHYRPDELRARRENRQLMDWSSAKVQKYLREGCELHGLHLREVQPNYTSRQCSRTGEAGRRCVQVSAAELLKGYWKKDVDRARGRVEKARKEGRDGAQADRLLVEAIAWAEELPDAQRSVRHIVLPKRGGDLFVNVSVPLSKKGLVAAVQADLNAAANIGLRGLLDPDWPGRWWFVPCTGGTFSPAPEKTRNAAVFAAVDQLPREGDTKQAPAGAPGERANGKRGGTRASAGRAGEKPIEYRWRDISAAPVSEGHWATTGAYWSNVEADVCRELRRQFAGGLEPAPALR
jgi:IS605 OrfB family transposase